MAQCLGAGHQMMLFLNRRGYAGFLSCRSCGQVIGVSALRCVSVSAPGAAGSSVIIADMKQPFLKPVPPAEVRSCVISGSERSRWSLCGKGIPGARILRMDLDTTREKDGHERFCLLLQMERRRSS